MIITAPKETIEDTAINNDAFFPAVDLAVLRDENRIDSTITEPRLRSQVIEAMINVNSQLKSVKDEAIENGINTLVEIEAEQVAGKSILEHRYLRAVGCLTKASLIERYRDYDSTQKGNKNADDLEENIGDLRRDAYWAIADILGEQRTNVELI